MSHNLSLLPCPFCGHDLNVRGKYVAHPPVECVLRNFDLYRDQIGNWNSRKEAESTLTDIGVMMNEFVDNWPEPKKVGTALALIAKTLKTAVADREAAITAWNRRIDEGGERKLTPEMVAAGREQAVKYCVRIEDFMLRGIFKAMRDAALPPKVEGDRT